MIEDSESGNSEERSKREQIMANFDMKVLESIYTGEFVNEEEDNTNTLVTSLKNDLENAQSEYDAREKFYEEPLSTVVVEEQKQRANLVEAKAALQKEELALIAGKQKLLDLTESTRLLVADIDSISKQRSDIERKACERGASLKRQAVDIKRLQQSEADVQKAKAKLSDEKKNLESKSKETKWKVNFFEAELKFWKSTSKSELDKRERLERLCRAIMTNKSATKNHCKQGEVG